MPTIEIHFRPLERFPRERTRSPKRSQFKAGYNDTLKLLEKELQLLGARSAVLQADCDGSEIRRDGFLRADARLRSAAVVLSFQSRRGPLSFPCDTYADWQDNVRAIAKSLEALRSVDRYGVTRQAEQYQGWAKLPPPEGSAGTPATGTMTVERAAILISTASNLDTVTGGRVLQSRDVYREAYRAAASRCHPDRCGGDDRQFKLVQEAKQVLDRHHGGAA